MPANDLARKQVHPGRQIGPILVLQRQVSDVADNHLPRTIDLDLSFQEQVRAHPLTMPGIGCAWHIAARLNGMQIMLAHQAPHPVSSDDGLTPQLGGDPPRTVSTRVEPKDLFHLWGELILPCGPLFPGVVTATTHSEQLTQNHCRVIGRLARDETIYQCQVCRLKMLKAFFSMSRSISTCLSRWRSFSTSSSEFDWMSLASRFQRWSTFSLMPRA